MILRTFPMQLYKNQNHSNSGNMIVHFLWGTLYRVNLTECRRVEVDTGLRMRVAHDLLVVQQSVWHPYGGSVYVNNLDAFVVVWLPSQVTVLPFLLQQQKQGQNLLQLTTLNQRLNRRDTEDKTASAVGSAMILFLCRLGNTRSYITQHAPTLWFCAGS